MRLAISGSHGTGKSTLIAAFVATNPHYASEPEAFELLADDMTLLPDEGPDLDGLAALIEHTIDGVTSYGPGMSVIFERSPVDYLAYAAASALLPAAERADFLVRYGPAVRDAIRHLDLVALLPVSSAFAARPGENEGFRERVDEALRCALLDDEYSLFEGPDAPQVVELSVDPTRRLGELLRSLGRGSAHGGQAARRARSEDQKT